jgi:single-strand DNA-binding protein
MAVRSLNKVMLIGNLTRDPEIRYTGSGTPVVNLGLATNKTWKDNDGEQQESAEFHNLVAWNKLAEICHQLLAKGMKIFVEGELNTRSWEDEGKTRYRTEVRINDMILLDSRGKTGVGADGSGSDDGNAPKSGSSDDNVSDDDADQMIEDATGDEPVDDDLPF